MFRRCLNPEKEAILTSDTDRVLASPANDVMHPRKQYYIWNNCNILYKHKSIFMKTWFDKGILLVGQLLNSQGYLMTYDEFP